MKYIQKVAIRVTLSFLTIIICTSTAQAQHMFDYSDITNGRFRVKSVSGVRSMGDGEHYTVIMEGSKIEKYSYHSGERVNTIFDAANHPELGEKGFNDYWLSPNEDKILLSTKRSYIYRRSFVADYWIFDTTQKSLTKLTENGAEQVASFSPDGERVAFVRENNIYYVDISTPVDHHWSEKQITFDGVYNKIINGHTDWVYEEEFVFTCAFAFSPNAKQIAYLRFDESEVPLFSMSLYTSERYQKPLTYKYPMAGENNSVVELWVYDLDSEQRVKVDTGEERNQYIHRLGWTPKEELYFYRSNRLQNHFELVLANQKGESRVIYSQKNRRYNENMTDKHVVFLPKGDRFVVRDECSGFSHLYLHSVDKSRIDTLTRGNWEVRELLDVVDNRVYYLSNEGSPLRNNLYSVNLNGRGKKRITQEDGQYRISPSDGFKYFISYFSNLATPNTVSLHTASGSVVRVLEDNTELKKAIEQRAVPKKEMFSFTTERSTILNGYIIKPLNFDPNKKYPLLLTQYNGPGHQYVMDRWTMDWTDVMVQEGYIVVSVDGRGTGGRGEEFKKIVYGNLGQMEMEDQISTAKYFATQPYIDMNRIGIYGWSYGGFMALNCILKGADVFKMAIAVAPVTSWRYYDSVYTERYNGIPQDNPRGYDNNSPVEYAHLLKGNLLIIHGSGDDNVHINNSYKMANALIKADKQFSMMVYPDDNHSMIPTGGRNHIYQKMVEYTLENL